MDYSKPPKQKSSKRFYLIIGLIVFVMLSALVAFAVLVVRGSNKPQESAESIFQLKKRRCRKAS